MTLKYEEERFSHEFCLQNSVSTLACDEHSLVQGEGEPFGAGLEMHIHGLEHDEVRGRDGERD